MSTYHSPVLVEPVGDPVGVRAGAGRLVGAAESLSVSARVLSDSNLEAVKAWESTAQRLFSVLADGFSGVVSATSGIATQLAAALVRYAGVLEACQSEVRLLRQRLDGVVANTPVGTAPDQAVVNALVEQANNAYARALQAARELSATVLGLTGNPTTSALPNTANDANVTFVSHAHIAGLASAHPAAGAFDAQAAHIHSQMNGVMASLAAYRTNYGSGDFQVSGGRMPAKFTTTIEIGMPGSGSFTVVDPKIIRTAVPFPKMQLSMLPATPMAWKAGYWALVAKDGQSLEDFIDLDDRGLRGWLEGWQDDLGKIEPEFENDIYDSRFDHNVDPYDDE